jgi:hypothetical protein
MWHSDLPTTAGVSGCSEAGARQERRAGRPFSRSTIRRSRATARRRPQRSVWLFFTTAVKPILSLERTPSLSVRSCGGGWDREGSGLSARNFRRSGANHWKTRCGWAARDGLECVPRRSQAEAEPRRDGAEGTGDRLPGGCQGHTGCAKQRAQALFHDHHSQEAVDVGG